MLKIKEETRISLFLTQCILDEENKMIRLSQRQPRIVTNAIILDDQSRRELKKIFPGKHPNYSGHHITISYGKNEYPEKFGQKTQATVIGYKNDEKCEAVEVVLNGIKCDNLHPHVTISHENGIKPVYANELLARGYVKPTKPLTLHGTVGSFINGKYVTEKPKE